MHLKSKFYFKSIFQGCTYRSLFCVRMQRLTIDGWGNYNCHIGDWHWYDNYSLSKHVRAGVVFHFHPVGLLRIKLSQHLYLRRRMTHGNPWRHLCVTHDWLFLATFSFIDFLTINSLKVMKGTFEIAWTPFPPNLYNNVLCLIIIMMHSL